MAERLLTPSKITAWLDCAHYLTLTHAVDDGRLAKPRQPFGSMAQMLLEKGLSHEGACLQSYRDRGLSVLEVPEKDPHQSFAAWAANADDWLNREADVVYQQPLMHEGVRGVADFLIRVDLDGGGFTYEPVDAKLSRSEAKPGHVLQLCFYADAIEAATGAAPEHLHVWLGSGEFQTIRTSEVRPYWQRLRSRLVALLADAHGEDTQPTPCAHCDFCEFAAHCEQEWRDADALHYVAGIRRQDIESLETGGIATLAQLAAAQASIQSIEDLRLERLRTQAGLQTIGREAPDKPPPFRLIGACGEPAWGEGFGMLPRPSDGDLFLDFEGHPFWTARNGLFFLFGLLIRDGDDNWRYEARWAHDQAAEAARADELIQYFANRRASFPDMHVYHYNHTERSSLERLATTYGVGEAALEELVNTGIFVDLLVATRNAVQVGVESYGLKHIERLARYERFHDISAGAGAVVEYEEYMTDGSTDRLDRIAAYNEDDVRATLALRNWLICERSTDVEWRKAILDFEPSAPELDEQVAALQQFDVDSDEHFLGDALGYWRREYRAFLAPKLAKFDLGADVLLDDDETIAGLVAEGEIPRVGKRGPLADPALRLQFPPQVLPTSGTSSMVYDAAGHIGYASICDLDTDSGVIDMVWNDRARELAVAPAALVVHDWIAPKPKPEAMSTVARTVLDNDGLTDLEGATLSLLRRDPPRFRAGGGPAGGLFTDDVNHTRTVPGTLDHSYLPVQGPPGTGKTFQGAHIVHQLLLDGQRVGITAMSHAAIENMLTEVATVVDTAGDAGLLRGVRKVDGSGTAAQIAGISNSGSIVKKFTNGDCNLIAGTTWLFANRQLRDAPVDVLVIDEAGQLALVDAIAAATSARSTVLLGDPLQLPQVAMATHPRGSGASVLEHILAGEPTIDPTRGVFLSETRRMHPDICDFISTQIYEGRLSSHESCAGQATEAGTGLRWLQATHAERSTEAIEEAVLVRDEIKRLIQTPWTNQHGVTAPLAPHNFMVVAPYNDQVRLLRGFLDDDADTKGVPVGTVDKFQGQEAAVVFFTMTTSAAEHMPRGAEFVFSRNRLNVAISRARCLAYLVCTDALLNTRARSVEDMRLIATLCAFVNHAESVP